MGVEAKTLMRAIGRTPAASVAVALTLLVVGTPAAMSLSRRDGTICVGSSACALSAINPA